MQINTWKRVLIFLLGFIGLTVLQILFLGLGFTDWMFFLMPPMEAVKHLNGYFSFLIYCMGLFVLMICAGRDLYEQIANEFRIPKNIRDGVTVGIIILAFTILYNLIVNLFYPSSANQNETSIESMTLSDPLLSACIIVLIAPVLEELTYRFGLFGFLRRSNRFLAYFGTVLVFSLIHFNYSSDTDVLINELLNLPSYMFAAAALSYAYDKNGLACSITAHAVNNLVAVVSTLLG